MTVGDKIEPMADLVFNEVSEDGPADYLATWTDSGQQPSVVVFEARPWRWWHRIVWWKRPKMAYLPGNNSER